MSDAIAVDRIGSLIAILGGMVLVGSALIARRERLRTHGGAMVLAWVAIFAVLILAGRWIDRHGRSPLTSYRTLHNVYYQTGANGAGRGSRSIPQHPQLSIGRPA